MVIGARLSRADESQAKRSIRGIVALNDVTARDLQRSDGQWTRAKGFDTFCPIGSEVPAPADLSSLEVTTRVNGSVRQHATASEMVFAIPMLLAYISSIMALEPGDVVATGTPAGVGRLEVGDVVEVQVAASLVRNSVAPAG